MTTVMAAHTYGLHSWVCLDIISSCIAYILQAAIISRPLYCPLPLLIYTGLGVHQPPYPIYRPHHALVVHNVNFELNLFVRSPSYNNYNNENLVSRHKMQMQTQQRAPLSHRKTRNETNVSSAYS